MTRVARFAAFAMALVAPAVQAQEAASFDRPGIGFGTATLPRGSVAWEQGLPDVVFDDDDGTRGRLYVADTLLRIGVAERVELQLGADSFNSLRIEDAAGTFHAEGAGDASLGLKWALPSSRDSFSWALQANASLPTGSAPFGGEERQYDLAVSAEWDLGNERGFALYLDRSFGDQRGWLLSPSYGFALGDAVGAYIEAGIGTGSQDGRSLGAGMVWQPWSRLQFDLSLLRGVGGDAPDWQGGFGVSLYFP